MKIRLLNGSHSALAYPAYLLGYRGVAEAVGDPLIHGFIRNCYMKEVGNTLLPAAGIDFGQYKDTLLRRFSNRNIADTVLRLAQDGSKKIANALLPPFFEMFQRGLEPKTLVFTLAVWARFLNGTDEKGNPIPLDDVNGSALSMAAKRAIEDPRLFLETIGIRELTPEEMAKLCEHFLNYLKAIYANGIRTSLKDFLEKETHHV
jgi:mannitol-1-phosphate/altronate dehydrogenase